MEKRHNSNVSSLPLLFASIDDFKPYLITVNVDDAVDDIVRQFKGVSDGFMRKVVGSTSPSDEACALSNYERKFSFNSADLRKHVSAQYNLEVANNISDEESERIGSQNHDVSGWHSDNELNSKSFPPRVIKRGRELDKVVDKKNDLELRSGASLGGLSPTLHNMEDPEGMPPEVMQLYMTSYFFLLYAI